MYTGQPEQARFNMIAQQIRPCEVIDEHVLETLADVRREQFVDAAYRGLAFADTAIPIGEGQVMMQPRLEGAMLQALAPEADEIALEIGTGSGFVTACLARMCQSVDSVETRETLYQGAVQRLGDADISNAHLRHGDGLVPQAGRLYDVIAVTGSVPEYTDVFEKQLALGGRVFIVVGEDPVMEAMLITRVGDNAFRREALFETSVPALDNSPRPGGFEF